MFQQPDSLGLHEPHHHVAQDLADRVEAFIGGTYVVKPRVIQQNLLHNKDSHSFGQLTTCLHDPEAQRDDFGGKKEGNGGGRIGLVVWRVGGARRVERGGRGRLIFDQRPDHPERRETEVLKRSRLGGGVQKGVEKKRQMSCDGGSVYARVRSGIPPTTQEQCPGLVVTRNTLQQCQGIADTIACGRSKLTGIQEGIHRNDLLQQAGHHSEAVPEHQSQLWHLLALLAQLHQGAFASIGIHEFRDPLQHLPVFFRHGLFRPRRPLLHESGEASAVAGVVARVLSVACGILSMRRGMILIARSDAIVMLVLGSGRGYGGRLSLGLLLSMAYALVGLRLARMLPGRLLMAVLLLVGEDVLAGKHFVFEASGRLRVTGSYLPSHQSYVVHSSRCRFEGKGVGIGEEKADWRGGRGLEPVDDVW